MTHNAPSVQGCWPQDQCKPKAYSYLAGLGKRARKQRCTAAALLKTKTPGLRVASSLDPRHVEDDAHRQGFAPYDESAQAIAPRVGLLAREHPTADGRLR